MSGAPDPHPAPHADKLPTGQAFFILFGGPVAWFVQLCASVALLGWPCFPTKDRFAVPIAHYDWTHAAALVLLLLAFAVAIAAGLLALRKFREVRDEKAGGKDALIEVGHGRTRFTALWGAVLGFSFAAAIAVTGVPLLMVSQCAG
jgi:uncharacterized membrane protein YcjF (UPF0283 family)